MINEFFVENISVFHYPFLSFALRVRRSPVDMPVKGSGIESFFGTGAFTCAR